MQQLNHDKAKREALKARLRLRIRQIIRASRARIEALASQSVALNPDPAAVTSSTSGQKGTALGSRPSNGSICNFSTYPPRLL